MAPTSAIYCMSPSGNILHMDVPGKSVFDIGPDSGLEPGVRAFRVLLLVGQRLHRLMDQRLRADGLTTQQAALLTVVTALGRPSLGEAADAMGTTHQNAAQLVAARPAKSSCASNPTPPTAAAVASSPPRPTTSTGAAATPQTMARWPTGSPR